MDRDAYDLPISALQHYLYCPRQCALIHVERQWAENQATAEGRVLHERTDTPRRETRGAVRTVTALPVRSDALGLYGVCDVVEYHAEEGGDRPFPVEYKRGRPKAHRADEVQLCAQALCLEAAHGVSVPKGALFYGKTRRRAGVAFDADLRALTERTARAARDMVLAGRTPPAEYAATKCGGCSLIEACRPQARRNASAWLERRLAEAAS